MAKKNIELRPILKRIGIDQNKLDDYMPFFNDELLFEPDYEKSNAPCLSNGTCTTNILLPLLVHRKDVQIQ